MEKKIRIFLMGALLISLIVVTYFIIFNSFIEMFELNLRDTLAILSSVFSLFGIIIAASVAIYVMNKNHEENKKSRIEINYQTDLIRKRQAFIRFGDILHISDALYKTYKNSPTINLTKIDTEYLNFMLKDLEEKMKSNLEIELSDQKEYKYIINASDYINNQIRVLKSMILLSDGNVYKVQKNKVMEYLKRIQNTSYDEVRRNKEFIFKQEIERI